MQLFAPSVAFVDLETTGMRATEDRVTEVGIVRVDANPDGGPLRVSEWSTLVNPGEPIPGMIQALTGITDAMVRDAPPFAAIASAIEARIDGCVFVAHNARFDHGFLKHEFARIGRPFSARALCTVKLSRRLFPDASGHGLDAIVARHGLANADRHRALGDARAIWDFIQALYRDIPPDVIAAVVKRILKIPSLPPQLPADALDAIPESPGVYLFYGENPLPLYVGKSINLRDRVAAHFCGDWQRESDLRLSQEIRRIEFEETAGEIGALLRESMLVKTLLPAHNHALRRKSESGVLELPATPGPPRYLPAASIDSKDLIGRYGPFSSKAQARATLRSLARENALCWTALGLERRPGPCFARQLKHCAGVCVGAESPEKHATRLAAALAPYLMPVWPAPGLAALREHAAAGDRVDVHVLRDWCWLGTARDNGELGQIVDAPPRPTFDIDIAKLLLRRHRAGTLPLLPLSCP
ncbi:MAG: exonuclease domain-containing protein [Betaproteobacteria bacterium]